VPARAGEPSQRNSRGCGLSGRHPAADLRAPGARVTPDVDSPVNGATAAILLLAALDGGSPAALITALPWVVPPGGNDGVKSGKLLEALRDRVILRSQIGKRKLDRAATRRELDKALHDLGERYRVLVRTGRAEMPGELASQMEAVRSLEEAVDTQDREIAELEQERSTRTT
jgi:hypothetical protein